MKPENLVLSVVLMAVFIGATLFLLGELSTEAEGTATGDALDSSYVIFSTLNSMIVFLAIIVSFIIVLMFFIMYWM